MVRRISVAVILTSQDEEESKTLGRLEGLGVLATPPFRFFAEFILSGVEGFKNDSGRRSSMEAEQTRSGVDEPT